MWQPKSENISFRVTKQVYADLEWLASLYGLKLSRFMDEIVCEEFIKAAKKTKAQSNNSRRNRRR